MTMGSVFEYGDPEVSACVKPTDLATSPECETEEVTDNSMDTNQFPNESRELSVSDGTDGPKLPILEKIDDLSCKVQTLKKEHTMLSNEVKDLTSKSFPAPEVLIALQNLSEEHELLKKKHMEESQLLKKKYLEECVERKRLYNELIEIKGNIRVFTRCRPINQEEVSNGSTSVVEITPSQDHELQVVCADSSKKQFKFDHVFGPQATQEDVFEQTRPVVTSVLDGYNVCIFAYGQTGTGKTFTMEGTPDNRGVNYRTLEELFKIADRRGSTMKYELSVSMLEVYNERIRDLLVENSSEPPKKLEIKQGPDGAQEVPGLVEARVYSTNEVWELLRTGSRVRSVGATNANELSSRSHCLLRVTVKGVNLVNGQRTKSNLWLVDLAGSERVGRIEVEGERLKESQFINKSLSALGDVISALASKTSHVPYRNSKLTHLLQSSLGGDCKTLMLVQISPSSTDLGETLCSLNFASRVKGIEYGPARKQVDVSELLNYKHLAEKLKQEEKEANKLQDSVKSLQLRLAAREHKCKSLQEKVRELENQLAEERKTRLNQESKTSAVASTKLPKPTRTEKKPPLGPSNQRMPLRRVSNFMPPPTPIGPKKASTWSSSLLSRSLSEGKENTTTNISYESNTKALREPRRVSMAVRPTYATSESNTRALREPRRASIAVRPTTQTIVPPSSVQPRRRVSIATLRPDQGLHIGTPLNTSTSQRASLLMDVSRARRFTKVFSPLRMKKSIGSTSSSAGVESTPMSTRKFMSSPPTQQVGSWKPTHPTVVALQKKPVVWSPLMSRGLNKWRKSIV